MLLVLGRRLANIVPTLLAVVALVFLLFSVLPGSFISGMNEDGRTTIDPAVMERMRKEMGLDDPLLERFAKYVVATATGDLGTSFRTREPVTKLLGRPHLAVAEAGPRGHDLRHPGRRHPGLPRRAEARQPDRHRRPWSAPSPASRCRSSGSA